MILLRRKSRHSQLNHVLLCQSVNRSYLYVSLQSTLFQKILYPRWFHNCYVTKYSVTNNEQQQSRICRIFDKSLFNIVRTILALSPFLLLRVKKKICLLITLVCIKICFSFFSVYHCRAFSLKLGQGCSLEHLYYFSFLSFYLQTAWMLMKIFHKKGELSTI